MNDITLSSAIFVTLLLAMVWAVQTGRIVVQPNTSYPSTDASSGIASGYVAVPARSSSPAGVSAAPAGGDRVSFGLRHAPAGDGR